MKKERLQYCDALKTISIFLIVAIHVLAFFRDTYVSTNRLYYTLITFVDALTRVGVPIFFMITGTFMLSKKREEKYSTYLLKRLPKLVIPFFLISIIYYLYENNKNGMTGSLLNFLQVFTSSGGVKYHFWFMYIIIMIYIFIPFLRVLVQNLKKKELRNLIIIIFVLGNVLKTINYYLGNYNYNLFRGFCLSDLVTYINYVLLGYYLYTYEVNTALRKKIYILGIIFILILPFADMLYIDNARNDAMLTCVSIFPFIPSIAFYLLFKYNYNQWKVPAIITKIINIIAPVTLYIYLLHVIIMEVVMKLINKFWFPQNIFENAIYYFGVYIITFVITSILAIICNRIYHFCETKVNGIIKKKESANEK